MPLVKREQTLTECLSNAVQQQNDIYTATVERLNSPLTSWWDPNKLDDITEITTDSEKRRHFDINRVLGSGSNVTDFIPHSVSNCFTDLVRKLIIFSMDDRFIPLSLFCAQLNLNFVVRCLRLPVAFVALAVLMYEAPKEEHHNRSLFLDTAVYILDIALNIGFLCGALVRFLSIPMMVRVERSFDRDSHPWHMLLGSGGVRDMPIIIACMVLGFSPTGMWLRLLLLISLTSSLIEAVPHLEILLSSIVHALGSISITIGLFFIALMVYGSFGYVLFRQNDPYHFGSLGLSIWTFFRFAIFDSWADLWHLNAGGCDGYPTIDIIMDFDRQHQQAIHTRWGSFHRGTCTDPEEQPLVASVVFISFLFLCAYVLVNSCTVAVVVGIKGGLEVFKNMTVFGVDHHIERLEKDAMMQRNASLGRRSSKSTSARTTSGGSSSKLFKGQSFVNEVLTVKELLAKIWNSADDDSVKLKIVNYEKRYGPWSRPQRVAVELRRLFDHSAYSNLCLVVSLMVALSQILIDSDVATETEMLPFNALAQILFTLDAGGRIMSYRYKDPEEFSDWGWLGVGCTLTTFLWVPVFADIESFRPFRMLRLVTALQYLTWIRDLELIMTAFTVSCYGLMLLGCLVAIAFVFFSVAAVMLFKDADPYKFGSIRKSFISLLQLMSYDGMEYMIRTSMLGCNHFAYQSHIPEFNALCKPSSIGVGWIAPVFCVIFCVVCSIILMSAMIGLIISSMESLMEIKTAEIEIWKDVAEVAEAYDIQHHTVMLMLELFELLDEDHHCHLTFLELQEMFEEGGIEEEPEQFAMFLNVDRDGSGQIEFPEFCELVSITGVVTERCALTHKLKVEADRKKSEQIMAASLRDSYVSAGSAHGEKTIQSMRSTDEAGLMHRRTSTKRAVDRKTQRVNDHRSRLQTKEDLLEHLAALSLSGSEKQKKTQFPRRSRKGSISESIAESSASYSLNGGVGSMNVRQFSYSDQDGSGDIAGNGFAALRSFKASRNNSREYATDVEASDTPSPLPTHPVRPLVIKPHDGSTKFSKAPIFSPIKEDKSHKFAALQRMPSWISGKRVAPNGGEEDNCVDDNVEREGEESDVGSLSCDRVLQPTQTKAATSSSVDIEESTASDRNGSLSAATLSFPATTAAWTPLDRDSQ